MRVFFVILGWFFFLVGFVGIFLPLLPTVPFILLSAYFFSKGSPRLYSWILSRPKIGPIIYEWNTYKVIRTRSKIIASLMIALGVSYPIFMNQKIPLFLKVILATIALVFILFIVTRKSKID